jgi:Zn finger protein HypA/HybF involved in hydrogenase expression
METVNLSEIKNFQNYIHSSKDTAVVERILFEMVTKLKGRKPTWYYKGKKIIIDITKENIEEIAYCDSCGYQESSSIDNEDDEYCPKCGGYGYFVGHRVKGRQHEIYSDEQWSKLPNDFKKKYIYLKRFDYLREGE